MLSQSGQWVEGKKFQVENYSPREDTGKWEYDGIGEENDPHELPRPLRNPRSSKKRK